MVSFALRHKEIRSNLYICATETSGIHLQEAGFQAERLLSGPLGGDAQIAAMLATGKIDMVIFFCDPLDKHPHEPDVQMLMRLCDVHNITLITNRAGAALIMKAL